MTPARFIAELIEGFMGGPASDAPRLPEASWLPRDVASAGRLVSSLRTRAERAVQSLLAEGRTDAPGAGPVVIDGPFLRDHGLTLLGAVLGGPAEGGAEGDAEVARPAYRAYRLDLVSIASEVAQVASEAGEGLLRAAGVTDPAGQLAGLSRGLDGLPWRVRDLLGAAGGLVAGLLDAAPGAEGSPERWLAAEAGVRGALEAAGLGAWPDDDDGTTHEPSPVAAGAAEDEEAAGRRRAEEQDDERS